MKEEKIDFVMLWVNEKDPEWQKEKNKYEQKELNEHENVDNSKIRYRDWENLKYWFIYQNMIVNFISGNLI